DVAGAALVVGAGWALADAAADPAALGSLGLSGVVCADASAAKAGTARAAKAANPGDLCMAGRIIARQFLHGNGRLVLTVIPYVDSVESVRHLARRRDVRAAEGA